MGGSLYLAWNYVRHHRGTTAVLVASITLIAYLPAALEVIVHNAEEHFRSRAASTPLVVGARGSPLELVLASVYFDEPCQSVLRMEQLQQIESQELGQAIPLHTRFEARDCVIVGTTTDYARTRNLRVARGRTWNMLGECVVGARVAAQLDIHIGGKIPVSTSSAFILDNAPLRLNVVGILAATETPDDEAIFVDLKTTWVIEGLGHGHASGAQHGSPEASRYTDITNENVDSFHFHGDQANFPITAIFRRSGHQESRNTASRPISLAGRHSADRASARRYECPAGQGPYGPQLHDRDHCCRVIRYAAYDVAGDCVLNPTPARRNRDYLEIGLLPIHNHFDPWWPDLDHSRHQCRQRHNADSDNRRLRSRARPSFDAVSDPCPKCVLKKTFHLSPDP